MTAQSFTHDELGATLLDAAIEEYLRGNFLPALVLAGAAEDHLGGPHARPDEEWAIDPRAHKQEARDFNLVHKHMFGEDHEKPWHPVNEVKNRAKHYNKEPLTIDAEDEAYWAIDRAIQNQILGKGTLHPRTQEVTQAHKDHLDAKG